MFVLDSVAIRFVASLMFSKLTQFTYTISIYQNKIPRINIKPDYPLVQLDFTNNQFSLSSLPFRVRFNI